MKAINIDINHTSTTRRTCLEFGFVLILGKQLIINRNKYEWETLDTPKIKIVFYSHSWEPNDYGTKVRIKCHQRIQRKEITIDGELCQNWELLDSFAVRLEFDGSINHTDGYKKFYDNPRRTGYWEMKGNGFR